MAEMMGFSVASASIATVQLIARLHSISSFFFRTTTNSQELESYRTRYEIELHRLKTALHTLNSNDTNLSTSVPMHFFEELHFELKKQAAALESLTNENSAPGWWGIVKRRAILGDKRRIEELILSLRRHADILYHISSQSLATSIHTNPSSPSERYP